MQRYLAGWLVLLLVFAPLGGAITVGAQLSPTATPTVTDTGENSTITVAVMPHQNPATAVDDGNPAQVAGHVEEDLGELLRLAAERLREQDYEGAQAAFGPEYQRLLNQYEGAGGSAAATFETAELSQREAIALAQQYQSTRNEYTRALATDDEEGAREAARQLQSIARDINVTAQELSEAYKELDNVTESDLEELSNAAETVADRVSSDAESIAASELQETNLTVRAANETAAFDDPVRIHGTLTTTEGNGSSVANETIRLQFSSDEANVTTTAAGNNTALTTTTTTDANGNFTVLYRPVQYPLGADILQVRYLPRSEAVHSAAEATTALALSGQTDAEVRLTTVPTTTRFNNVTEVAGTVRIQTDSGVDTAAGLPILVALGNRVLGTTRTSENGTFSLRQTTPAAIANGTQDLVVRVALTNSAVASAVTITPVRVAPTETRLDIETQLITVENTTDTPTANTSATDNGSDDGAVIETAEPDRTDSAQNDTATTDLANNTSTQLRVYGTLQTTNSDTVPNQTVALSINETVQRTVETGANGSFGILLTQSEQDMLAGGQPLRVSFDGEETNLASTASTTVPFPAAAGQQGLGAAVIAGLQAYRRQVLAGLAVLSGLGGAIGWYVFVNSISIWELPLLRRINTTAAESSVPEPQGADTDSAGTPATPRPAETTAAGLLADAEAVQSDDPATATRLAYLSLRTAITEHATATDETPTSQTHWEFYDAHRDASANTEAFKTLTQTFERAQFADVDVSANEAETAVTSARTLVNDPSLVRSGR